MRSVLWRVVLLNALQACATAPKPHESPPQIPPATTDSAPTLEPRKTPVAEVAKLYRAPIPVVVDAALKVYRDREVEVFHQETKETQKLLLSGRGRFFEYSMMVSPDPSGKTSVTLRCVGSALRESFDEAMKVLDLLSSVLLEPRE